MIKRQILMSSFLLLSLTSMNLAYAIPLRIKEFSIPAEMQNKIIGVRLVDLVNTNPNLISGLPNLVEAIKKNPSYFVGGDNIEVIHDVFLNKLPESFGDQTQLNVTFFVKQKNQKANFEKMTIFLKNNAKNLEDISIAEHSSLPLKNLMFTIKAGLVERKLIIEDEMNDIKMVFPIGVGSFDEGVLNEGKISLVTPRFKHAFIDQRAVISKREKPKYFKGKPFIRILNGNDLTHDITPIGFHIEINDSFVRGFDSHGCMRLRDADLMAFHDLIMLGSVLQIPVEVKYNLDDVADHPAGKRNKTYKTVLNVGTKESPFFTLDRDNLVQMVYKENTEAPIANLKDEDNDNYYDLFNYDTASQMREQDQRRKNECNAKVMNGEIPSSKLQECLDKGKRKDSLADRLYRKMMGIDSIGFDDVTF